MIKKTMNKTLIWGIGLVLFMMFQIGLPAAPGPKPIKGMVIFDFTTYDPKNDAENKAKQVPVIYTIENSEIIEEVESYFKGIDNGYESHDPIVKNVLKYLEADEPDKPDKKELLKRWRWYTKKSDPIQIYAFYDDKGEMDIDIKEEPRKTRIGKDISLLSKLLLKKLDAASKAPEKKYLILQKRYYLKYPRATMTITGNNTTQSQDPKKPNTNNVDSTEILTGDSEHWFLSADLLFKKPSELKLDQTSGSIEPKEKPTEFYLGINYVLGDLSAERPNSTGYLFLKGMLRFSKRPLDSFGFALGYRFPETKFLGFDLSPFSVFAGWIGTRQEEADEANNSKRKFKFAFGLSFNLDKALEWMK